MAEIGHSITIRSDGPAGTDAEVLIDGKPVKWVTECEVRISYKDFHQVTLTLIPQRIEVTLPDGQIKVISPVVTGGRVSPDV